MQDRFAEALLDPSKAVPDGVIRPDGKPAEKRFNVYRNNVVVSLVDALGQAFPAIKALVGDEFFEAMAREFVPRHPPTSPLLMFYGADFPAFLATFPPAQGLPYLPDVARLELARRDAYHAADAPLADLAPLAELSAEALMGVTFVFQPAVQVISAQHPVLSIWRHALEPDAPAITAASEDVLVTRPGHDVMMQVLPDGGAQCIDAARRGATLGRAAEAAEETDGFDLAQVLTCLFEAGALTSIKT